MSQDVVGRGRPGTSHVLFAGLSASVNVPWAVDTNGTKVPTHFEINGTELTQVIKHKGGNFTYGITTDPDWIYLARCGAAIAIFAAGNLNAAGKITRVIGKAASFYKTLKKFKSKTAALKSIAYDLSGAKGLDDLIMECWP